MIEPVGAPAEENTVAVKVTEVDKKTDVLDVGTTETTDDASETVGVPWVDVPLNAMLCVAEIFKLSSVRTSEPLSEPTDTGVKPMGNSQEAPAASDPSVVEVELTTGQSVVSLVKFGAMLGLLPAAGTGNVSVALPAFSTVTVCGLSPLVVPIGVEAKVKLGASTKSSFSTPLGAAR